MMGLQLQLILTACIVDFRFTFAQAIDQAVASKVNDESKTRENFQKLFNSIAKNNPEKSEVYSGILQQEVARERQAFETIKAELQIAQNRNVHKKRNTYREISIGKNVVAVKRETDEKEDFKDDVKDDDKEDVKEEDVAVVGRRKRTKCKIQELTNTSLEFGECMVNPANCDVYWCCDETDRFGELLKYKCEHTVLRLYPLLTNECRKQKCLPEFTWDDSYLTESPYERTMSKNPIIEKITEGIPPDDPETAAD